jgi:hypothetical protein
MPHDSDVQLTSHDRHDTMLVAALAAGDLAATDRDQAIALTASCTECATLRDDLVAIARATALVPPPIAASGRDFRLTPADAARLRPGGWRRLVAAFSAPRAAFTRPLGVGLTTLGLVGLLIGNVQLTPGGTASTGSGAQPGTVSAESFGDGGGRAVASAAAPMTAASGVPGDVTAAGPGASGPAASANTDTAVGGEPASGAGGPDVQGGALGPAASGDVKSAPSARDLLSGESAVDSTVVDPLRPLNLLFIAAVLLGLGLLVGAHFRSRLTR